MAEQVLEKPELVGGPCFNQELKNHAKHPIGFSILPNE
jgi:hypothetical protein